jgi:enoyl-CoA hydratase/carnithine racemase
MCSSVTFLEMMGLAKANEMLLLSWELNARTNVHWGASSRVIPDCDDSCNPFHANSLASHLYAEIDERLLQLPKGQQTAQYFISMLREHRCDRLSSICCQELLKLDERFDNGDAQHAAHGLRIGSGACQRMPIQSKL